MHFTPQQLLTDATNRSEENEAKKYINTEPPEDYILDLIQTKINTEDCKQKGWIMEGYPVTKSQALALQSSGILVDKVIILEAETQHLHPRAVQQNTVEKFEQALQSYQKNIKGVFECYKAIAKRVPVGDELLGAFDSIKTYLDSKNPV